MTVTMKKDFPRPVAELFVALEAVCRGHPAHVAAEAAAQLMLQYVIAQGKATGKSPAAVMQILFVAVSNMAVMVDANMSNNQPADPDDIIIINN